MANTRTLLIESALNLFASKGYTATGTAEVCAAAGVQKGTFYHHFASKTALLSAVLEFYAEPIRQEYARIAGSSDSIDDRIRAIFAVPERMHFARVGADGIFVGCLLGNITLEMSQRDPAISRTVNALFDGWRDALLPIASDAGHQDRHAATAAADRLLTLHQGAILTATLRGDLSILARSANDAVHLFVN
jgi:TetR/AcrR family transcriptional regulator, transcriptional repressor for nem operon